MLKATCAVCKETVRVASQKLVTVQWVDTQSGGLCALHFHSDCYFRWYEQTAAEAQRRLSGSAPNPSPRPAALPAPREGTPTGVVGELLTEDEKRAMLHLRRRIRTPRTQTPPPEAGAQPSAAAGEHTQGRSAEQKSAPPSRASGPASEAPPAPKEEQPDAGPEDGEPDSTPRPE